MQTQCPHCDTRFRVTENQVNAADGFVRCGICQGVFNAFEVANDHGDQASLLDEIEPADVKSIERSDTDENMDGITAESSDSHREAAESGADAANDDDREFDQVDETAASRKDAFDFFDEDINEPLPHVVPDKFKDDYASRGPSAISTLLWSVAILLLTATFILQYIWFNREQFHQVPEVRAAIKFLCEKVDCSKLSMRDPQKIKLVSRNIYTHPDEKEALMINLTFKNDAEFAQPFPIMQIAFSDVRGGIVAARRFSPQEYLRLDNPQIRLLQPFTSIDISLAIKDPGKQAMTYEFDFL